MPPLSRLARWQIAVVIVVGLLAVVYAGIRYVRLDEMVGVGAYSVTVEMSDSGGIFTNAEVTYLGVPAGRVGALRLTKSGVSVELVLDSGGPQIPASATAVVANRSAIGEQFVDLRPSTTSGSFLHDGSVIEKFELPPPLEDVVSSALDFADSIPVEDLRTVVTELGNAFSGQGENLSLIHISEPTRPY